MENQHHHYDIDQIERQIRAGFAQGRQLPRATNEDGLLCQAWQDNSEEIRVQFNRLMFSMINSGVEHHKVAYVVGVILADCAGDYTAGYDLAASLNPVNGLIHGFQSHLSQLVNNQVSGDFDPTATVSMSINPVASGRA